MNEEGLGARGGRGKGLVFGGMGDHGADGFVGSVEVEGLRVDEGLDDLRLEVVHPFQAPLHV